MTKKDEELSEKEFYLMNDDDDWVETAGVETFWDWLPDLIVTCIVTFFATLAVAFVFKIAFHLVSGLF